MLAILTTWSTKEQRQVPTRTPSPCNESREPAPHRLLLAAAFITYRGRGPGAVVGGGTTSFPSPRAVLQRCAPYLLPSGAEHGLLDVRVHAAQGVVPSWNALEVAQSTVLVPHHLLHHGGVTSQLHCLPERGERGTVGPRVHRSRAKCTQRFVSSPATQH